MKKKVLGVAFGAALLLAVGSVINADAREVEDAALGGRYCARNGVSLKKCKNYGYNWVCSGSGRDCRYTSNVPQ